MFTADKLREKYLNFMKSKGHTIIPSASLVPENDPSVLFTTAGMHPLVPYLLGEKHPGGSRVANVQKCIRTGDIDEVGDSTHHTFFEMLGNWSFGDYFKKEAIEMSFEFLTSKEWLNLDKKRIAVSVFVGDEDASFDQEAYEIWRKIFEENNLPIERIAKLPKENNWWGMETGPCGPDSEMFFWVGDSDKVPEFFNDDNDLWVEIWNDVFMQYNKKSNGVLEPLEKKNVDTGMGMERTLAALNGLDDNYRTELFWPIIQTVADLTRTEYGKDNAKSYRIIADHLKAATFIISDGVTPSNVQRGYVLRRLIRRAIRHGKLLGIENNFTKQIAEVVVEIYKNAYPEVENKKENIFEEMEKEEDKFRKTLSDGLEKIEKYLKNPEKNAIFRKVNNQMQEAPLFFYSDAVNLIFDLYQTNGFPFEMSTEELKKEAILVGVSFDENRLRKEFDEKFRTHQELSRTASAGMFKGGLADTSEATKKYHTAAHLMLSALRKVLGEHVFQKGSNITPERLRFDFSHPEKLTEEQKQAVEKKVNEAIEKDYEVKCEEMSLDEAKKQNAMGVFESKYGEKVKVYTIGEESAIGGPPFSREICGGPHAKSTGKLGKFKIQKEESSSAGVRRIKAILE
jgi:alanyl-tRNA synthetase